MNEFKELLRPCSGATDAEASEQPKREPAAISPFIGWLPASLRESPAANTGVESRPVEPIRDTPARSGSTSPSESQAAGLIAMWPRQNASAADTSPVQITPPAGSPAPAADSAPQSVSLDPVGVALPFRAGHQEESASDAGPTPAAAPSMGGGKMGERLVSAGLLTPEQVQQTIALQQTSGLRFGEAAIQLGFVSERDMQNALSEQFNYATALMAHPTLHTSLAIAHSPFGKEAEAIRQIRAEISLRLNSRKYFSLAVVSPNDGDGKSYVAASLAVAYSQSGQRVLLINADLRGAGTELFKLKGVAGLSTMLAGRESHVPGQSVPGFPLLHVLSAGPTPPNPTEILGAPALQRFIDRFRDDFDVIVVDTPAANRSADAQIIASQTDVCMVVVRQDTTLMADLRQTQERMRRAGAKVVGSVYNSYAGSQATPVRKPWWAKWLRRR